MNTFSEYQRAAARTGGADLNVEKLRARYPHGFTTEDSVARRDEGGAL